MCTEKSVAVRYDGDFNKKPRVVRLFKSLNSVRHEAFFVELLQLTIRCSREWEQEREKQYRVRAP